MFSVLSPPRFLQLPVYALDISNLSYKYIRLGRRNGNVVVENFGEGILPAGVIDKGEIKNQDALLDILKEFFERNGVRYVAFSLPEERGFLTSLHLPTTLKKYEIGSSLALQLEEHIPLPAAEAVFDYTLISEQKNYYDIVLRAFPRSVTASYCDVIRSAGALPVLVEPELNSALRAIVPGSFQGVGMLVDWGQSRASFAIFDHATVRFATTVPIGGTMVTDAIAKQLHMSAHDANDLKKTSKRITLAGDAMLHNEAAQAIMPVVSALREEMRRYLDYWQTRPQAQMPKQIFLIGGEVNISGFPEYLSKDFGIPVVVGNPWENVSFPPFYVPDLPRKELLRFASAIGLGLQAFEVDKLF